VYTVDDINDGTNPAATKTPVIASAKRAAQLINNELAF
jgi:hypothetical protein